MSPGPFLGSMFERVKYYDTFSVLHTYMALRSIFIMASLVLIRAWDARKYDPSSIYVRFKPVRYLTTRHWDNFAIKYWGDIELEQDDEAGAPH